MNSILLFSLFLAAIVAADPINRTPLLGNIDPDGRSKKSQ